MLRPVSFSYLLLLAQTPREFVMREVIYNRLWPGEMDYEGSNKPYERQISDHKRKLVAEIKRGIGGRMEIGAGEMETLIATRHKMGYMLNFARENILVLRKGDFLIIAFLILSDLDRFFSDLSSLRSGGDFSVLRGYGSMLAYESLALEELQLDISFLYCRFKNIHIRRIQVNESKHIQTSP